MTKNTFITITMISLLTSSANAASLKAVWTGVVPGSSESGKVLIISSDSKTSSLTGKIKIKQDGTFRSTNVAMKSLSNTNVQRRPVSLSWAVKSININYNGVVVPEAKAEVFVNGSKVNIGEYVMGKASIRTHIIQQTPLSLKGVTNSTVFSSVAIVTSSI
ncbi:hypothetical protein [Vibrio kanaloae]|uniref:Uncharacterized protein n=1 Tax=Vibrio kanaloae TaxID=170673 RepID=A0A4U1YLC5_9VIBR|nr:hypothetical protein [Vibrio kanaloae]TKF21422.1 hypothetical protein FCV52_20990 [Vibrio kanaloae]TKF78453.1 hypothetical protein FCV62_12265 [Vibrio kanaloae]